jgi:signal-transduction protein with cAMP-binding, CBS, and nucleotidyltransferase domain
MLQIFKGGQNRLMKKVKPWMYDNGVNVNRTDLPIDAMIMFETRAIIRYLVFQAGKKLDDFLMGGRLLFEAPQNQKRKMKSLRSRNCIALINDAYSYFDKFYGSFEGNFKAL